MIYINTEKPGTISFPIWKDIDTDVTVTIIDANGNGYDIIDCNEKAETIIDGGLSTIPEAVSTLKIVIKQYNTVVFTSNVVPLEENIRCVDFELTFNRLGDYTAELYQNDEVVGVASVRVTEGEEGCRKRYIIKGE